MKNFRFFLLVFSVVLVSTAFAETPDEFLENTKQAEQNYLAGVNSDNFGLKMSSIYFLGEYNCSGAVIPLLKILKSDDREEARIAAALALYKINDARGNFAVKQAVRFDDSNRVKKICCLLYTERNKPISKVLEVLASR